MKRDMDLVRKILLMFESEETWPINPEGQINGFSKSQIDYHVELMKDSELLESVFDTHTITSGMRRRVDKIFRGYRLTWQGHDFLDAARDDTRWTKAKGIMTKIGGGTLEILKDILKQVMADQVKQVMGIQS